MYLSKELDEKPLIEKISFIWTVWTCKDGFFDETRKGQFAYEFAFKLLLWGLR